MKNLSLAILSFMFFGCHNLRTSGAPEPKDFTDAEVNQIISNTMHDIQTDLQGLKATFPQLENIESSFISTNRFEYSHGQINTFTDKKGNDYVGNACRILFVVEYPSKLIDTRQHAGLPEMRISNGKCLKVWILVAANQNEEGKELQTQAFQVISKNLSNMLDKLGHSAIDPYSVRQDVLGKLSPDEKKKWKSFYSNCEVDDSYLADSSEYRKEYEDGYRNGYAYFKVFHRRFGEVGLRKNRNLPQEQKTYLLGWRCGELKADEEFYDELKAIESSIDN